MWDLFFYFLGVIENVQDMKEMQWKDLSNRYPYTHKLKTYAGDSR